jgi:single-strand DNA-binding protein
MSNNFSAVVRIGKDAVTRTAGSTTVTSFSGANNVGFGDKQQTLWIDCSVWGDRGSKSAKYLTKGGQVWVSGELSTREHEGKTYLQLRVSEFDYVGKKSDSQPSATQPQSQHDAGKANAYQPDNFDDAIPF